MKFRHFLAAPILALAAALPLRSALADTVPPYVNISSMIQGQASNTQSFDVPTAGVLTVTLADLPLFDPVNLSLSLSTTSEVIGSPMGIGTESINVGPGMIYASLFANATGSFGMGGYSENISFQPSTISAVPLPTTLVLLISGLGVLLGWQRRPAPSSPSNVDDEALTI